MKAVASAAALLLGALVLLAGCSGPSPGGVSGNLFVARSVHHYSPVLPMTFIDGTVTVSEVGGTARYVVHSHGFKGFTVALTAGTWRIQPMVPGMTCSGMTQKIASGFTACAVQAYGFSCAPSRRRHT